MTVAEEIQLRIEQQLEIVQQAYDDDDEALARGLLGQLEDLREEARLVDDADKICWTPWDER